MPVEISQTLDRGPRVLALLAEEPDGLTVSEVAARLGLTRTVAYRLSATLARHNLVRHAGPKLQVGPGVLRLSAGVYPRLRDLASPVLRTLADRTGCTAHLTVADGAEALALAVVEPSWTDFHVAYRVGARHSLSRGAAGRAILLGRNPDAGAAPYVITSGELQPAACGLAAPVRGVDGLEASVGIVTLGELDEHAAGVMVAAAATELAERLS